MKKILLLALLFIVGCTSGNTLVNMCADNVSFMMQMPSQNDKVCVKENGNVEFMITNRGDVPLHGFNITVTGEEEKYSFKTTEVVPSLAVRMFDIEKRNLSEIKEITFHPYIVFEEEIQMCETYKQSVSEMPRCN